MENKITLKDKRLENRVNKFTAELSKNSIQYSVEIKNIGGLHIPIVNITLENESNIQYTIIFSYTDYDGISGYEKKDYLIPLNKRINMVEFTKQIINKIHDRSLIEITVAREQARIKRIEDSEERIKKYKEELAEGKHLKERLVYGFFLK